MYNISNTRRLQVAMETLKTMFPMPEPRLKKCEFLFDLASKMKQGVIVELGTYHGTGTIALCLGAEANSGYEPTVYTVDDYTKKAGWMGEPFGPEDREVFLAKTEEADVFPVLIQETVLDAAADWYDLPIGLLFWDTGGISYNNGITPAMLDDISAWEGNVCRGGRIFLRDTYSDTFRHDVVVEALSSRYEVEHEEKGICILVRR